MSLAPHLTGRVASDTPDRFARFWFAITAALVASCSGKVIVPQSAEPPPDACAAVSCGPGTHCDNGACVNDTTVTVDCNAAAPNGTCPTGEVCVQGVCYTTGTEPPPCAVGVNGWCDAGQACVSGVCQPIGSGTECSSGNPTGVCPGGEVCVSGICYVDQGVACSPSNINGVCPAGQTCVSPGTCVTGPGTCSSSNPNGSCPTWQICVQGACVGPVPPDACSATQLDGRCPADEVCVGGTCTPIVTDNVCSLTRPNGLCPAGAACVDGSCVAITPGNQCSLTNPTGLCPGGAQCVNGTCTQTRCEVGGWLCDPGEWCTSSTCTPLPCDPAHPQGACIDPTEACDLGVCVPPDCSTTNPNGVCPSGLECRGGSCQPYLCSATHPSGVCLTQGDICVLGNCLEGPCDPNNLDGTCATSSTTCDPSLGCTDISDSCCDAALAGSTGCQPGTCTPTPCSINEPRGVCPTDEYCNGGNCEAAPCSPDFPNGWCANSGDICQNGGCVEGPCAPTNLDGTCSTTVQTCDPALGCANLATRCCDNALASAEGCSPGTCAAPHCSASQPRGVCPANQYCTGAGGCQPAPCGPYFPTGTCPGTQVCQGGSCASTGCSAQPDPAAFCSPQICIGDSCVTPCSVNARLGWCPPGLSCVGGGCSPPCANDLDCDAIADADENTAACSALNTLSACGNDPNCLWVIEQTTCYVDTDQDGSPDSRDRDSDGDSVPDNVEAGDLSLATPPNDADGDGVPDARSLDADGDHMSDTFEVGPQPRSPRDSDGDGLDDYVDTDSDNDGVLDACEVAEGTSGLCSATGIVDLDLGAAAVLDSDGDTIPDYRDLDSDNDGITDNIEARVVPATASTLAPTGVDHDADGVPDYRDPDSDGDGVADVDEDMNGDGIVDCQLNGVGAVVIDSRPAPACGATIPYTVPPFAPGYAYDYNPSCPANKCVLAESSRVHPDTDGDGIPDGQDGTFLVCSTANLKPINIFYSQPADFALALETRFDRSVMLKRGAADAGMTFDDANASSANDGSTAVAGFVLNRVPVASARAASDPDPARNLIVKALAQETSDRTAFGTASGVTAVVLVISRNFTSFDGYGAVVSRYSITTSAAVANNVLRDNLVRGLDGGLTGYAGAGGPSSSAFTLVTETLYRYDNGSTGTVMVAGALVPTSSPSDQSYAYRGACTWPPQPPTPVNYILSTDLWRYYGHVAAPNAGWNTLAYNDTTAPAWSGPSAAPIGYGEGAGADVTTTTTPDENGGTNGVGYVTIYVRRQFTVATMPTALSLNIDWDDGFVAYINGTEVARSAVTGTPTHTTLAANNTRDRNQTLTPFDITASIPLLVAGNNVLSIEVHNNQSATTNGDLSVIASLTGTIAYVPPSTCPAGCSGSPCTQRTDYQIPLFFADNVANGSALAQYGDDLAALCQSLIQKNGKLDFLWAVDNSGSMAAEIGQVQTSAKLFFQIFNNTEADYRVAQTTSSDEDNGSNAIPLGWELQFRFDENVENAVTLPLASDNDSPGGRNGYLTGEFTGAIAGMVDTASTDRTVTYTCSEGCYIESCFGRTQANCGPGTTHPECRWNGAACEADCCPACAGQAGTTVFNDPACYFGARLPDEDGSGDEHTLQMAEWATYRAGAVEHCSSAQNAFDCALRASCTWNGTCVSNQCAPPASVNATYPSYTQESCNGNDPTGFPLYEVPYGVDDNEDEPEPMSCEWNPTVGGGACWPNVTAPCAEYTARGTCTGVCATYSLQAACQADTACQWYSTANPPMCRSTVCAAYTTSANCNADPACYWWTPPGGNQRCIDRPNLTCPSITVQATCNLNPSCEWRTAGSAACFARTTTTAARCSWNATSSVCVPTQQAATTLCSGTTQLSCIGPTAGWCQWDALTSSCSAPTKRAFRSDATHFLVALTDEEECMLKDLNFNGDCEEGSGAGTFSGFAVGNDLRLTRTEALLRYFRSRDFTVFGIMGDKNTGCATASSNNTLADVAESSGGGWGSICAADLFPTIEAIVISAVAKASPYKLEGFIDGKAVQPISSTIKVAVQVCDVPAEYPNCTSGTHMEVVPRSREDGFDYDALNNTLILYGSARPVLGGDIVASYRYWIDNSQPPQGGNCPCPETTAPGCACPQGTTCGIEGGIDNCAPKTSQATCQVTPGCAWNAANGGSCAATGLCEPDPTCGGSCPSGTVCDPGTGLCVCDVACGTGCPSGQTCDGDTASPTCGQCLCDITCGGGCPAGSICDGNTGSPTCGQCACDTTCGGGCASGLVCNSDPASPSCGFCQPPNCTGTPPPPGCCPDADIDGTNVCSGDCVDTWATYCGLYGSLMVCANDKACTIEQDCIDMGSSSCTLVYTTCPPAPVDERVGFRPQDIGPNVQGDSFFGGLCGDGIDNNCDGAAPMCGGS